MDTQQPNPAPAQDRGEVVRNDVNVDYPPGKCADDFGNKKELDGKSDSGPEPDVFGREIPPQD